VLFQRYGLNLDPHNIDCFDRWAFTETPFEQEGHSGKSKKKILFEVCGSYYVRVLVSLLVSLMYLVFFSIRYNRSECVSKRGRSVLLLGFGAGAEEAIFAKLKERHRFDNVVEFAKITKGDYFSFGQRPKFFSLLVAIFRFWWRSYRVVSVHKRRVQSIGVQCFVYLSSATFEYAVWYCWAKASKGRIRKAYVICNDLRSFALVNNNIEVEYVQHGFLSKYLVFPDYDAASVMTSIDRVFVSNRVPSASVKVMPEYEMEKFYGRLLSPDLEDFIKKDVRSVFVASVYGSDFFYERVKVLFDYLIGCGSVNVTVKVHPAESNSFWYALADKYQFRLVKSGVDLIEALESVNPDLFVSWYSTSFLDALKLNIRSLSLCTQEELDNSGLVFNLSNYSNTFDDLVLPSEETLVRE